ncbi:MAG: carboxypeptidase M32 [Planctomycetota bacterium]|nr:MAG: carboxypeptidase M32 [Planctomycetota bacterium]REJ90289.1 MAG: carboxypeptidase M32 [Planctomycetota bacterium]REK17800.1 MAG: carboxypeptidase M32 [Planctomycetota bacterium]REK40970.1 MAG: carboxypeptidase M32 [Planctomycetota bacterium]
MAESDQTVFDALCDHTRQTATLASIESVLGWDERTQMPSANAEYRAEQMTLLSGMIHQRNTDPRVGDWLAQLAESPLAAEPHSDTAATIRVLQRKFEKQKKLPQALVEELTRTAVMGQQTWQAAREKDDYAQFCPIVEKMFELKRQQADALGHDGCRYDALLDDFEPEESTENVDRVLRSLREELVPLVAAIAESSRRPPLELLKRRYPIETQQSFGREVATQIGFDFARGRLDESAHPFCNGLGPHDTRITTRYDEHFMPSALFGTMHEAGHGIYDQGLRTEWYGLPPGSYISLGIHESQSRMWENQVGRSEAFWRHFFPHAQRAFPEALADAARDEFYFAINNVEPSLIRVEADEATYNLHILIRFELELALIEGELKPADAPAAWNEKYREYLGIEPKNDAEGILQDIHWSFGAVGYFPTYSLGNLYAAQFFEKADEQLGGLADQFARGEFAPLRQWLQAQIHERGECYTAAELVREVTGDDLSHDALMRHLRGKLVPLYDLS